MILKIFLLSVIVGTILARLQTHTAVQHGPLKWNIFRFLMLTILFALITGIILHQTGQIDSIRLYLYLISTGTSIGLFMMLERIVKKHWATVALTSISAGVICYLFMNYKTDHITRGSFVVGMAPGIGYLILGFIKKYWTPSEKENSDNRF